MKIDHDQINPILSSFFCRYLVTGAIVGLAIAPESVLAQRLHPMAVESISWQLESLTTTEEPDFSGTGRPGRQTAGDSRLYSPSKRRSLSSDLPC